jgi:hypothetical protein
VNGETIEVPLSELPNGYSRTEDYKQKTAAVAEERRQLEALKSNVEAQTKAEYANQLEEATNLFINYDPVIVEYQTLAANGQLEALKQTNADAYVAITDAFNERVATAKRMQQRVEQARSESQQHQQQQLERERAERFDRAADEIVKLRPELADEGKFREFANDAVTFMKDVGFTGEEIVDALDHRVLALVDLAREGKAARAAKQALPERKVVPKSAVKPLTSDGSGSSQPRSRFPANAQRDRKGDWIANQILSDL